MMRLWLGIVAILGLSACMSPMADIQTLAEQDIPEAAPAAGIAAREEPSDGGLFGLLASGGGGKDIVAREVPPGTVLPYGEVARVCGLRAGDMGTRIASYPERRARHAIHDSNPGAAGPRSFYVTGFGDGCARQFTASMAMFGTVALHEKLRYGLPAEVQPYSNTDKAYETLKMRVCGVPRQKPCGGRVSRLERDTVFVTVYERFGGNATWKNLLLHDGDVIALDLKSG